MICDYFVVRKCVLRVDDLYLRGGVYEYSNGFNWCGMIALALGAGTALIGLEVPAVRVLYDYSWFVGFAVSFVTYLAMMKVSTSAGACADRGLVISTLHGSLKLRQNFASITFQRFFFVSAHQIQIKLRDSDASQLA